MELYETNTKLDKMLQKKMDENFRPFGGSFELLPLCNMDCKMCYVKRTPAQVAEEGRILDWTEWLDIGRQARDAGVLFLLLTGGEPLLYPHFKELYRGLNEMGLVLTLNTNGTLIDQEWADFFQEYPCSRINITIYGKDDETYGRLCSNPQGYSQVIHACRLLKKRRVPFRLHASITPDNYKEIGDIFRIAHELDAPLRPATYMFPGVRIGHDASTQQRLDPETAGRCAVECYRHIYPNPDDFLANIRALLTNMFKAPRMLPVEGFNCHASRSGFWINWKGQMQSCGMQSGPLYSLLDASFESCWNQIVEHGKTVKYPEECRTCSIQNICTMCVANLLAENQHMENPSSHVPEYLCRYSHAQVEEMIRYIPEEEQDMYRRVYLYGNTELIF